MGPPSFEPIGRQLASASKAISRAFDDALVQAGGSLSVWLVLVSLKSNTTAGQRQLAEMVGVEGPTLTHHLNRMEQGGLITRTRDPANRRQHQVELTEDGEALFLVLAQAAQAFDAQLRRGVTKKDIDATSAVLARLRANAESMLP